MAPDTVLDTPAPDATAPVGPVSLAGSASDDQGIAGVRYAVQHRTSGQWWTGGGWSATQHWFPATVTNPGAASTAWSATWTPPSANDYRVSAQATDTGGNDDATPPSAPFTVALGAPDSTPANGTVSSPKAGQAVGAGPVTFAGRATDDSGVGWVDVAVQDRDTKLWWNDTSGTWGPFVWNNRESTPATPGASPTTWSYTWNPGAAGNYRVGVRARDNGGRADPTPAVSSTSRPADPVRQVMVIPPSTGERLAGDVAGGVGGEEDHGGRQLGRVALAAGGDPRRPGTRGSRAGTGRSSRRRRSPARSR